MADTSKLQKYAEKGKIKKIIPYASNKSPEVRIEAARAFSQIKSDDSFNQMVLMLEDSDQSVRTVAAEVLGAYGDKKGMEHLRHALTKNPDEKFQEVARKSMAALKTDE